MKPDDIDRILSTDDLLEPSSNFTAGVMAAISQPAEPPPLRFPWFRFLAGVFALLVMAVAGAVLLLHSAPALKPVIAPLAPLTALAPEFGYAIAVMLLSLALVAIPRILARS
ncbi:MAG TPA: hypothetical protein VG675_23250 [Bryobacteraceae bacterium]|nr:hypothetical protein [Bryobacteraceae bacterium]